MSDPTGPIAPLPESNQADALSVADADRIAQQILKAHKSGLDSRRERDLVSEKLLLHIDGAGDNQWADVLHGSRVEIPRIISEYRKTENLLRLVVDNAVAHHTTMPLRFIAESTPDRESRTTALIDALTINHVAQQQDWAGMAAEALYLAMPTGYCPLHCYWREDEMDQHEPLSPTDQEDPMVVVEQLLDPKAGMVDCWLGNPFDTVYDRGARRGSVHWLSYGRVLPAEMVRNKFGHMPGVAGLEGTTRLPSASMFQRIARTWRMESLSVHGTPVLSYRRQDNEGDELMVVICREILPGVTAEYPNGRLQIIAVPGSGDLRTGEGQVGYAKLLADQKLPGGDFSCTNFYSHHRSDDIHGKPWIEDLDQLQVDLNIAISKRWELINQMIDAPIVAPGGAIADDMADIGGYNLMEIEPSYATWRPQRMQVDQGALAALNFEIQDKRQAIFRGGGYQAASRGEAQGPRQPYRAIVALQQADNSIHGPVHMRFQRSMADFARRTWRQIKAYADVPFMLEITGDEYAYLAEPYVDKKMLSRRPPNFKLVNAFGPSPELRAQEVLELMRTVGADGVPFLTTREARRQYPNPTIFDADSDPQAVAQRRAKTVAQGIHDIVRTFRKETGFAEDGMGNPAVFQAAQQLFPMVESQFPRLRDDDLEAHLRAYSEITQDERSDAVARMIAVMRQELYYQWQAQMAAAMAPADGQPSKGGAVPRKRLGPSTVAREGAGAGGMPEQKTPTPVATAR